MEYTRKTLTLENNLYGISNVSAGVLALDANARTPVLMIEKLFLMFNINLMIKAHLYVGSNVLIYSL
jgi:hypothetical protein